jgi:hypothetical protein
MRCRSGTALIVLLSLCAAPIAGADAAGHGSVDVAQEAAVASAGYQDALDAATEQWHLGDTSGALIAFERLLADPRLSTLDTVRRSDTWLSAAIVAGQQNQQALAEERLRTALSINPRNALARLTLAGNQLVDKQVDAAADNVILALDNSEGAAELDKDMVWHLDRSLTDSPARRRALLQALFDHGWKSDGIEPASLWVALATLQLEAGQQDKVAATLERVDEPLPLVKLRSDRRFDRYVQRGGSRFDPEASAQRHIDRLRVETMLSPGINDVAVQLSYALLVAGQPQEVIGMTQTLADVATKSTTQPSEEQARSVGWMLDVRSRAQRQLGQSDAAVDTQMLAVRMAEPSGLSDQQFGLANLYISLHRPALARQTVKDLADLNAYGEGARQLIELVAALQLKDAAAAQRARDALFARRDDATAHYMASLVADGRLDAAAALLTTRLADPLERGDALLELQELRMAPLLPGELETHARWEQFVQRADVKAAVRRVGRMDSYALYNE